MNLSRIRASTGLLSRYVSVFAAAWASRRASDFRPRAAHELAFLPASLELIETPIHPAPRWVMHILVIMGLVVLAIGLLGKLDIVATAKGKLLPDARVKIIQPAVTGVVRRIAVADGQRVNKGDVLMELDPSQAAADTDKASLATFQMALAMARSQALLDAQRLGRSPLVPVVPAASDDAQKEAQHYADGLYREYQDKRMSAEAELAKREAELVSTQAEIAKFRSTAPLARQQANDYAKLATENYVAKHDYLDKEQAAITQEQELKAEEGHAKQLEASIAEQRAEVAAITSQFRREQLDTLDKATQQYSQNKNDATKAVTREKMMTLTAPVSGTVQQLAIHTLGGVVTTAQALMTIVPDDTVLVEATVENKDVGFVNVGQSAIVKLDAFPYTRYGYLTGKVESLSNDAVADKKLGLAFIAHVRLASNRMWVNDKWVALTPGMEATAEINTGKRTVLGYFLDPLIQTSQESLHER